MFKKIKSDRKRNSNHSGSARTEVVVSIKATQIQDVEHSSCSFYNVSSRPVVKAACAVKFEFWKLELLLFTFAESPGKEMFV